MKNSLEIINQFILRSNENIDTDGVWPAYKKLADYFDYEIAEPSVILNKCEIFIKCGNCTYRIKQLDKEEGNSREGDGLDVYLWQTGEDND